MSRAITDREYCWYTAFNKYAIGLDVPLQSQLAHKWPVDFAFWLVNLSAPLAYYLRYRSHSFR